MSILLERLDAATKQPQESVDITNLIEELDAQGGINLTGCFPTGTWRTGDQTPSSTWDLDKLTEIFTQAQQSLLQKYPETPGFSEKPAADLTEADKAFLASQIHTSTTNESGVHVVRLQTPLPPQPSAAAPLIGRIGELIHFFQAARNSANPVAVMNTLLTLPAGDTVDGSTTQETSVEPSTLEPSPIEG